MSKKVSPILGAFVVVAFIAFIALFAFASSSADSIEKEWTANESLATSAPQQSVTAEWAIKDAELSQLRQNGVRNGLLAVCAALLGAIAVSITAADTKAAPLISESLVPPPTPPSPTS
jgi:hypothetical protein